MKILITGVHGFVGSNLVEAQKVGAQSCSFEGARGMMQKSL